MEFTISCFNKLISKNSGDDRLLVIYNWNIQGMKFKEFKQAMKAHREIGKLHTELKEGFK